MGDGRTAPRPDRRRSWSRRNALPRQHRRLCVHFQAAGPDARFGEDGYRFAVNTGDVLDLRTATPAGGPMQFGNVVDPVIESYAPDGTLVALADNNASDGGPSSIRG